MKCPNCRCVIPNHSMRCIYCGHTVPLGDETTVTVRSTGNRTAVNTSYDYDRYRYGYYDRYGYGAGYPYTDSYAANGYGSRSLYQSVMLPYDYYQTAAPKKERSTEFDFSLVNDDGSLDVVKSLIYFIGFDIVIVLLLFLLVLVSV